MQQLEKNRDRIEHDILIMQSQIEHYNQQARLLRIASAILVVAGAGLVIWMLPAFSADIGPGTAPLEEYTPERIAFIVAFLGFLTSFFLLEYRLLNAQKFARKLGIWIKEKQTRLEKIV
jgi:hypothetical protein